MGALIYEICLFDMLCDNYPCIGSEKAFRAIKKQRINSEPLDKSFVVHFIIGIPTFIISLYYILCKSDGSLVIFGVIVFSGIIALLYGLYYDRNKR